MTETLAPPRHKMQVLTRRHGDKDVTWDKGKPVEIENARAEFDDLVKKHGYAAFAMDPATGGKGQRIKEFDPTIEKMLLVPQMQGG